MQPDRRLGRVALLAAVLAALALVPASAGSGSGPTASEAALVRLINRFRAAHGVAPLRVGLRLRAAARQHSRDMLRRGYFAHGDLESRLRAFGVTASIVGENIAWGSGSDRAPSAIMRSWTTSAPHRANLLEPRFRRIGVGLAVGTFAGYAGTLIVTADFAG